MYIYLYVHVSYLTKILYTKCLVVPGVLGIVIITMQWYPVRFPQISPVRCIKTVGLVLCLPVLTYQVPADHGSSN